MPTDGLLQEGAGGQYVKDIPAPTLAGTLFGLTVGSNGLFDWRAMSDKVVSVTDKTHLASPDPTKVYIVGGVVDLGSTPIGVPVGGLNIIGYTFDVSQLISSEGNYTMFISPVGGSGNIVMSDIGLTASGASSQLFDVKSETGNEAFEFNRVNFNNCTKIGVIDNYRQGFELGTGRFGGTPTLELKGAWSGGYFMGSSIVRGLTDGAYSLFKAGTGFVMQSRFKSNQNVDLPASASYLDFAPSNIPNAGTLQLQGMEITRDGVYNAEDANITPNITRSALSSYWKNNNGMPNTFVGGTVSVISEVETVIANADEWTTIAGTFLGTDLEHFSSTASGQLMHLGNSPREFEFTASLTVDGGSNDQLGVRFEKWDDSASAFVPLAYTELIRQVNALVGSRDVAFFTFNIGGVLDKNDFLRLQVRNINASTNITLENGSFFRIQER